MNLRLHLTFQASDEDDLEDFTAFGYKLRKKLLPPTVDPEQAVNLTADKKCKLLQKLLDEQIDKLKTSKRMLKWLERKSDDEVPCPVEHVVHFRRVIDIVIAELKMPVRAVERARGSCVGFKVVAVPESTVPDTPSQGRSQLPFSQGMLEVNNSNSFSELNLTCSGIIKAMFTSNST